VSNPFHSDFWSRTTGRAGQRTVAALLAAAAVFAAPGVARAGDIAPSLATKASSNPKSSFPVIIQTKSVPSKAASVEVNVVTTKSRNKAVAALAKANDESKKSQALKQLLAGKLAALKSAQANATSLSTKAAKTKKKADLLASQNAQVALLKANADAKAVQAASDSEQNTLLVAQLDASQAQAANQLDQTQAAAAIHWQYKLLSGVSTKIDAADLPVLEASKDIVAVSPDAIVAPSGNWNSQKWVRSMGAVPFWYSQARQANAENTPTIAIVDSGVDGTKTQDFGGRFLGQVDLTTLEPNAPGDGRGHGTMVASIAAGGANPRSGVDPDAPILSLDVMNDDGEGNTSDVIAACDWILQHKDQYNIRVANFSLTAGIDSTFVYDPLSKAVEKLWFDGVVVVAAAGNYAVDGAQSDVHYAPGSDPFVITVGAVDINDTASPADDFAAPWSAWGYTNDGFLKPDLAAPGRYLIGAVPAGSTLAAEGGQVPSLVPTGYIQLSGTSFAAPMVSGAAAAILAAHPDYTPGQVKGLLMLTAAAVPDAVPGSVGVGELDLGAATAYDGTPPDPDAGLEPYIVSTDDGPAFDASSWMDVAQSDPTWNAAAWTSAAWTSASWNTAAWTSASWNTAAWTSAAWTSAAWTSAAWTSAAWTSASWNTGLDANPQDGAPADVANEDDSTTPPSDTCDIGGGDGSTSCDNSGSGDNGSGDGGSGSGGSGSGDSGSGDGGSGSG